MKPERRNAGRKEVNVPSWYAINWDRVEADSRMPQHNDPKRNRQLEENSSQMLPLSGTPKMKTPTTRQIAISTMPSAKWADSLPSTSSVGRTGVESSCSMVPFSHSRAMVSEVSSDAMIIRMTAMSPGTM